MLRAASTSKHNVMSGKKIPHPKSTNFDESSGAEGEEGEDFPTPPAKRIKHHSPDDAARHKIRPNARFLDEIPDSDDDDTEQDELEAAPATRQTDLETALPPIRTDHDAIEAYEASRAADDGAAGLQDRWDGQKWVKGRSSIYVDAFNLALDTVLEEERHLFDEAELSIFEQWARLSYEAQYLYVRLFLRKTAAWHRINRLGYHSDVADLTQAITDLQTQRELPVEPTPAADHVGEDSAPEGTTFEGKSFTFADCSEDCIKDLDEASSLLRLDELKSFAKEMKVQGKNKTELLRAFRRTSGQQTGLGGFVNLKRSETEESITSNTTNPDDSPRSRATTPSRENRDVLFVHKILAETGPLIRLSLPTLKLFERVHLVFYRSTEWTDKSLSTIILARIARRNFPSYIVSRSANIFPSRALLLEFEAALRTQFHIDSILEFGGTPSRASLQIILDLFDEVYPRWQTLLDEELQRENSIYSTGEGAYLRRLSPAWVYTRIVHKGAYVLGKFKEHAREHATLSALLAQRLFHTSRRGDWYQRKALLEEHYMYKLAPSTAAVADKGEDARRKHWRHVALATCEQGLQDQLTHLIFHHDLQKRITKLEKALKVPKRQQHEFAHAALSKPLERTFYGIRIELTDVAPLRRRVSDPSAVGKSDRRGAKTIWLDPALLTSSSSTPQTVPEVESASSSSTHPTTISPLVNPDRSLTPGIFREGECSVEEMCLSQYRAHGWKGYHSEGGILRTLFAYLFFDVLFIYMPHVFQTAYQTCPLDLHTDAFYPARMSEVHARLNELSNGDAATLLQRVWDEHSERKTCIVGLDWMYALEDLLEIVRAFPPAALSAVMRVMAQEYAQRGGGVPDLFLWKPANVTGASGTDGLDAVETGLNGSKSAEENSQGLSEVMFAEVKSENDRLSDTQRMWIDVLSGAGIRVELCHAAASEVRER